MSLIINDKNFTYNEESHRYILTINALVNLRGIEGATEFSDEDTYNKFLNKMSNDVYQYCYNLRHNRGSKFEQRSSIIEFLIFTNNNNEVEVLVEAMLDQCEYALQSGGDLMPNEFQHKGQLLTLKQQRDFRVSVIAKDRVATNIIGTLTEFSFKVPTLEYRVGY